MALNDVSEDREETVVTRAGYELLKETASLLQSPVNARRLLESVENLEAGRATARELLE